MNNNRIVLGDRVKVQFVDGGYVIGFVDYMPSEAGECWIILGTDSNKSYYVQTFSHIMPLSKEKNE